MPTRKQLKDHAKSSMSGRKPSVYLVTIVYLLILYILGVLSTKLSFPSLEIGELASGGFDIESIRQSGSAPGQIIQIALDIMSAMLGIGFSFFCLKVTRGAQAGFGELFDAFGMFFKFLWLTIVIWFFTFLWTLLLIVPGIIASYRYSMAIYIMMDNPEFSALECINRSKEMMDGHKAELFVLNLSFIGWWILCIIPFVGIYVYPYTETTTTTFYNCLLGSCGQTEANDGTASEDTYTRSDKDPWEK